MAFHSMSAFALARIEFPGRDRIFFAFFSTILVSMPMIIVPLFMVVRELGLLNTLPGVAAPMIFQGFALFLLRQFYLTLPTELEESARLDGRSEERRVGKESRARWSPSAQKQR